jgi:hypothetical protein
MLTTTSHQDLLTSGLTLPHLNISHIFLHRTTILTLQPATFIHTHHLQIIQQILFHLLLIILSHPQIQAHHHHILILADTVGTVQDTTMLTTTSLQVQQHFTPIHHLANINNIFLHRTITHMHLQAISILTHHLLVIMLI